MDKPGQLEEVSRIIAELGANVTKVDHNMNVEDSDINGCYLTLRIETRNFAHIEEIKKRFREEGFEIGDTESPIIPLYVRDIDKTFIVTKLAFDNGVFINPVIPPACAPQDTLVRLALMATHTEEQVERGVQILKKIFVEQGIIK